MSGYGMLGFSQGLASGMGLGMAQEKTAILHNQNMKEIASKH